PMTAPQTMVTTNNGTCLAKAKASFMLPPIHPCSPTQPQGNEKLPAAPRTPGNSPMNQYNQLCTQP
ncbi:hypothetical protein, partial [Bifidobacterium aemilianum]|uniref:hypothetical protein n=1 Tax=Bifidobacterium aemilianum TaxID=2493120 RepID=UPI001F3432AD